MAPFCAPVFEIWNLNKITIKSEHKKVVAKSAVKIVKWGRKAPPK